MHRPRLTSALALAACAIILTPVAGHAAVSETGGVVKTHTLNGRYVASVTLVKLSNGALSAQVVPTAEGRRTLPRTSWGEVLTKMPAMNKSGLYEQFECHRSFAQTKASWNLEPDRVYADGMGQMLSRCNTAFRPAPFMTVEQFYTVTPLKAPTPVVTTPTAPVVKPKPVVAKPKPVIAKPKPVVAKPKPVVKKPAVKPVAPKAKAPAAPAWKRVISRHKVYHAPIKGLVTRG